MSRISKLYAQALYDLAKEEGLSGQLLQELDVLDCAFSNAPDFIRLLGSPALPVDERCRILDRSFRDQVHPYLLHFLMILTKKGYIRHFSGCCRMYRRIYNRDNGILPVTAYTAVPLSDALRSALIQKLSALTGKTIELHCRIDPEVLGGVRLNWEGRQLDGTLRGRLEEIGRLLQT